MVLGILNRFRLLFFARISARATARRVVLLEPVLRVLSKRYRNPLFRSGFGLERDGVDAVDVVEVHGEHVAAVVVGRTHRLELDVPPVFANLPVDDVLAVRGQIETV
jgi:hypothetical protein